MEEDRTVSPTGREERVLKTIELLLEERMATPPRPLTVPALRGAELFRWLLEQDVFAVTRLTGGRHATAAPIPL